MSLKFEKSRDKHRDTRICNIRLVLREAAEEIEMDIAGIAKAIKWASKSQERCYSGMNGSCLVPLGEDNRICQGECGAEHLYGE